MSGFEHDAYLRSLRPDRKNQETLPETAEKALSYCPVMPTDHIGCETVIEARANKYAGTSRIVILREGEA